MKQKLLFILMIQLILTSCKSKEYKKADLIGKWAGYDRGGDGEYFYSELWFSDSMSLTWIDNTKAVFQYNYLIKENFIQNYGYENNRKKLYPITLKIISLNEDTLKLELLREEKEVILTKIDTQTPDIFVDQEENIKYYDEFNSRAEKVMNLKSK